MLRIMAVGVVFVPLPGSHLVKWLKSQLVNWSRIVSIGMSRVPLPGGFDDGLEVRVLGFPAKLLECFFA